VVRKFFVGMPIQSKFIHIQLLGHGSAVAAFAGSSNLKTLGIEQFTENHAFGSSHGKSRIIRVAYFEDPRCKIVY
jgi:sarcosine oxidase